MAGTKRGLGRGLGALFGEDTIEEVIAEEKAADRKKANGADRIVEKNSARTQKKNEKKSESEAGKVQNANLNQKAQESAKSVSMLGVEPEQEAPAQTELDPIEISHVRHLMRHSWKNWQIPFKNMACCSHFWFKKGAKAMRSLLVSADGERQSWLA